MEPAGIALRLLTYLQGGLLLGVLLFWSPWTGQMRFAAASLAAAGAVLTAATMLVLAASFSEGGALLDAPTLWMLLTQTAMGWVAIARIAVFVVLIAIMSMGEQRHLASMIAFIAIGSFGWNGHGAMTNGGTGWLHLAGNALHLIAGLSWIGAIAAFLWAAMRPKGVAQDLFADLERFAKTGTILVAVVLATGISNTFFIVGWDGVLGLVDTIYGRVLLMKISLFIVMLGAAATNRFWLSPRLVGSSSFAALRVSLGAELLLGLGVLALVALVGTLDPAS